MKQVTQSERQPRYRTETRIVESPRGKRVERRATHPDAVPFLEIIVEREALAELFFGDLAQVVRGKLQDDRIVYPFVPYPSLADLVREAVEQRDATSALQQIRRYISFLEWLPSAPQIPTEFCERIGADPALFTHEVPCFEAAPRDCIPQNVLVDPESGRWHLIDHEWMYETPMPVELLIYLAVASLVIGLQPQIQASVSPEFPVIRFAGYWNERFIPLAWVDVLRELELPLPLLDHLQSCIQSGNLETPRRRRLRVDVPQAPLTALPRLTPLYRAQLGCRALWREVEELFRPQYR